MNETDEMLAGMKPEWDKLRAEGVPIGSRPLHPDLPWSVQFEFQAKDDPTGKDMAWWKANQAKFSDFG
jgi:hypothetical protein